MDARLGSGRLRWLDGMKGISILWIAYFHSFTVLSGDGRFPKVLEAGFLEAFWRDCAPASTGGAVVCGLEAFGVAFGEVGFHAVSVFLVLSGFGLAYSLSQTGGNPPGGWLRWYRSRMLRLFPMYWLAHIVYLVSPFQVRYEPVDYRFLLSFLGDRIYPVDSIFYYFNPALWYFGLLLELYLVFPVLYRSMERIGPGWFLGIATVVCLGSRYLLLCWVPVHGYYVEGAFFGARLFEFALGMVLGALYRREPSRAERWLFSPFVLIAGTASYTVSLYTYAPIWAYTFTVVLIGAGLSPILAQVARALDRVPALGPTLALVGTYSYGLYLLHQPYVLYFATAARHWPTPSFVAMTCVVIALLTVASIGIEREVNRFTRRALG